MADELNKSGHPREHASSTGDGVPLNHLPGGRFAEILLHEHALDEHTLHHAVEAQHELSLRGYDLSLSRILVDLGTLSETRLGELIREYGRSLRIGELIYELEYISLDQLAEAEKLMNKQRFRRMGEILQKLDFVDDCQLAQALSVQLSIPLLHIEPDMIDTGLVVQFPMDLLMEHLAIPFHDDGETVSVIIADPLQESFLAEIGERLGRQVKPCIGIPDTIRDELQCLQQRRTSR